MAVTLWLLLLLCCSLGHAGILYPRESEMREVKSLDGLWDFYLPDQPAGAAQVGPWGDDSLYRVGLPNDEIMRMPVPASYNDVTVDSRLRDHVGIVWYERRVFVPRYWQNQRVFLRFGSVHYRATVWVNGYQVAAHEGGHLPFQAEVTQWLDFGAKNRITVSVDNELTSITVPQGNVEIINTSDNNTRRVQTYTFDFFNYAGIHRSVVLYTVPYTYVDDITVSSTVADNGLGGHDALVSYGVAVSGLLATCLVSLVDASGVYRIQRQRGCEGVLIELTNGEGGPLLDVYRMPVGVRSLSYNSTSLLINERPIYIRGVGRHEDADVRGKGFDRAILARDTHLMHWLGANCYRTSHYPYSEESMQVADQEGLLVIDEISSVNTEFFSNQMLELHSRLMTDLIQRDKNYASVIMWSLANEPRTQNYEAEPYFRGRIYWQAQLLDIICFNRYNAWYSDGGRLDVISIKVQEEARNWYTTFGKPIIMAEYGADTMPGLHREPAFIWSEEFQTQLLSEHFKAFDQLRSEGFFIGEMIWNFADFQTDQSYTRVGGNNKGVFTRQRQPKAAAHLLRQRYWALANLIDGAPARNTTHYVASNAPHTEL
ncbi:hypothetical protein B566_EDAN002825 [Ephemera danica]|nr:hypothetical protein B566_EDAN002825 [Ephemera danica]